MTKHINYDKFLEWLDMQIGICQKLLDKAVSAGEYYEALGYEEEIEIYEFLKNVTQSNDWGERASFVEVVEDDV